MGPRPSHFLKVPWVMLMGSHDQEPLLYLYHILSEAPENAKLHIYLIFFLNFNMSPPSEHPVKWEDKAGKLLSSLKN